MRHGGERAVVAAVAAQPGERDEDLAGVGDDARPAGVDQPGVAHAGGRGQQLVELLAPGGEQDGGLGDVERDAVAGPAQRPAQGRRGGGRRWRGSSGSRGTLRTEPPRRRGRSDRLVGHDCTVCRPTDGLRPLITPRTARLVFSRTRLSRVAHRPSPTVHPPRLPDGQEGAGRPAWRHARTSRGPARARRRTAAAPPTARDVGLVDRAAAAGGGAALRRRPAAARGPSRCTRTATAARSCTTRRRPLPAPRSSWCCTAPAAPPPTCGRTWAGTRSPTARASSSPTRTGSTARGTRAGAAGRPGTGRSTTSASSTSSSRRSAGTTASAPCTRSGSPTAR